MTPQFHSPEEASAYLATDEARHRFEEAKRAMRTLKIAVTAGDAEMVAAWAEEGLKGESNAVARAAIERFRQAFNDAARAATLGETPERGDEDA